MKTITRYTISALMVLGVALVMFTPDIGPLYRLNHYAIYILFLYLAAGMILLIFGRKYTMITALACAGTLALFLKQSTNTKFRFADELSTETIRVSHFNTSDFNEGFNAALKDILENNPDIISIQELTPDWSEFLESSLKDSFPHILSQVRIDPLGSGIYSKRPFTSQNIKKSDNYPYLTCSLEVDEQKTIQIISIHLLPALDQDTYKNIEGQLKNISASCSDSTAGHLILGNFNVSPWSREIVQFKYDADLLDSRRQVVPSNFSGGRLSPFRIPVNHMFHSTALNCISFYSLFDDNGLEIGITGDYQYNNLAIRPPILR